MGCGDKEQGSSLQDRVSHLYTLRFRLEYKFYLIQKKSDKRETRFDSNTEQWTPSLVIRLITTLWAKTLYNI